MKKEELRQRTDSAITETKNALQTVYDSLNHGQRMQIIKDESVRILFDRYGVDYEI